MSFLAHFARSMISTLRTANLTNQLTAKLIEIVRGESTRSSAACLPLKSSIIEKVMRTSGRKDCLKTIPICGIEIMANAKCHPKQKFSKEWEECCQELCQWAHPRFDDLYYKPSNKDTKKFQQTWCEYPEFLIKPVGLCCYREYKYKPPPKRKPPKVVQSCPVPRHCHLKMLCRNRLASKCAKITWPGCRGVRDPPSCATTKRPQCCTRPKTPYPSFSECSKDMKPARREVECACLKLPLICWKFSQ